MCVDFRCTYWCKLNVSKATVDYTCFLHRLSAGSITDLFFVRGRINLQSNQTHKFKNRYVFNCLELTQSDFNLNPIYLYSLSHCFENTSSYLVSNIVVPWLSLPRLPIIMSSLFFRNNCHLHLNDFFNSQPVRKVKSGLITEAFCQFPLPPSHLHL